MRRAARKRVGLLVLPEHSFKRKGEGSNQRDNSSRTGMAEGHTLCGKHTAEDEHHGKGAANCRLPVEEDALKYFLT